jgi:hypothetical protein
MAAKDIAKKPTVMIEKINLNKMIWNLMLTWGWLLT